MSSHDHRAHDAHDHAPPHPHDAHDHAHHAHDHAHDAHDHAHDAHDHAHDAHDHLRIASVARPHRLPSPAPTGVFTPGEARQARRLTMVLALVGAFFALEFAGALAARSVVLEADALHLLMDICALAMSLVAMRLAVRRPTPRFTFGLRRAEPVAAIFNAMLVLGATVQIVHEAILELRGHASPEAGIMFVVASAALVVNGVSAWLLHGAMHPHDHGHGHGHAHSHAHSHAHAHVAATESSEGPTPDRDNPHNHKRHGHALNLRGAWLHLLGDILGSLAALVAAVVIRFGGPSAVDPLASFLVAIILVLGALRLLKDATLVLLEAAPVHLPVSAVREAVSAFVGVRDIHDLHVWTLGAGHDAITVHVRANVTDATLSGRLSQRLRERFDVEYVTVQVELCDDACGAPPSPELNR